MTPHPRVVSLGYNIRTDEMWFRFATGEVSCVDAVDRGRGSNYTPNITPAYALRHGRLAATLADSGQKMPPAHRAEPTTDSKVEANRNASR